jgi:hypothetical protein
MQSKKRQSPSGADSRDLEMVTEAMAIEPKARPVTNPCTGSSVERYFAGLAQSVRGLTTATARRGGRSHG